MKPDITENVQVRAGRWPRGLVALFSVFALFLGSALATSADEGHRLMIVDAFSEGVSSGSEIYAVPEEQVQKILKNEPNEIQSVRKFCQSLSSPECAAQTGLSCESISLSARKQLSITVSRLLQYLHRVKLLSRRDHSWDIQLRAHILQMSHVAFLNQQPHLGGKYLEF